ncbi:MAG: hypothetical protein ACHQHN_11890 [Sphingobacteriales bacterium]
MKKTINLLFFALVSATQVLGQTEIVVPMSNRSSSGMEKNLLFFADKRFTVSQQGSISLPLANLFDGNYQPNYSSSGIDPNNPYVVTIENLPNIHVQAGAWVGWTSRYWSPVQFKIEVYNTYDYGGISGYPSPNTWVTVADVSNYGGGSYITPVSTVSASKIRFTFYQASGPNNMIGISELFFIHPEATVAYDGLMVKYDANGNVGIGTSSTNGYQLAVKGNVHAKQVNVDLNGWSDYVFDKDYSLPKLSDIKAYIGKNHHLPDIPSEQEVVKNGVDLGEMNKLLMKKVEELTLYLIEDHKKSREQEQKLNKQQSVLIWQQNQINSISKRLTHVKVKHKSRLTR